MYELEAHAEALLALAVKHNATMCALLVCNELGDRESRGEAPVLGKCQILALTSDPWIVLTSDPWIELASDPCFQLRLVHGSLDRAEDKIPAEPHD